MRFLQEVSEEEKRAYRERLLALLRQSDNLDAEALRKVRVLTRRLQKRILERMRKEAARAGPRWGKYYLPLLAGAIEELVQDYIAEYGGAMSAYLPRAWELGAKKVDIGLESAGAHLAMRIPSIDPKMAAISTQFSADLIQSITEHTRERINREIATSITLGEPPYELMRRLAGMITTHGTPFHSVAYRAELIARTELSRVQELSTQYRMEQTNTLFPELGMRKQFIVAYVLQWPCPICRTYEGRVYDISDPDAPVIPVHPNCRCSWVPHFPNLYAGRIDAPASAQQKATVSRPS